MTARPAPPAATPLLALLALLAFACPPSGAAPSPAAQRRPADPDTRARDARRRYQDLVARLRTSPSAEDANPARAVRILAPELRLGSHGHLLLRISRASLTGGLPATYRVHRALLRLSPTEPKAWDVTRPLQRELRLRGPRAATLRLRLSRPAAPTAAPAPSSRPRLELHLRAGAARGRRSAHAHLRDDCPLGPGRCCGLHAVSASPEDLGWANWLLSPPELQLHVCAGACPARYRPAGTHAQAKARLHRLRPDTVPAPCCVPSDYEPVVLALRGEDGGVAFMTLEDLVPRSCHCA
ncbi:growth/differentiation factor 15 [Perognathus longimembris pacificus]|uniref:growth/differentiation factor 15 n=1 Tax=Perognathus longimembris pacificus TaxID=214514 RepID=UPI0020197910|nr:growth/differentiation factor 15 [Perognathus longimembris pacificus]